MYKKQNSLFRKAGDCAVNWFKRGRTQQVIGTALKEVDPTINWEHQTEYLALSLLISDRYQPLLTGRDLEAAFLDEAFRDVVAEAFGVGSAIATVAVVKALTPDQGTACNLSLHEIGVECLDILLSQQGMTGIKLEQAKLDFQNHVTKKCRHYVRIWNEDAQMILDEMITALPNIKRSYVIDILSDVIEVVTEWRASRAQLLGLKAAPVAIESSDDEDAIVLALWLAQEYPEYSGEAVLRRVREAKGEWLRPEDISTAQDLVREFEAAESRVLAALDSSDITEDDFSKLQAESGLLRMRIDVHIEGPFTKAEIEAERREILDNLRRLREQ